MVFVSFHVFFRLQLRSYPEEGEELESYPALSSEEEASLSSAPSDNDIHDLSQVVNRVTQDPLNDSFSSDDS